jgi:hypothetical protein
MPTAVCGLADNHRGWPTSVTDPIAKCVLLKDVARKRTVIDSVWNPIVI